MTKFSVRGLSSPLCGAQAMSERMNVRAQVKEEWRRKTRQALVTDWKRGGRKALPFC